MRRVLPIWCFVILMVPAAHAHGTGLPISPAEVGHHWNFSPWLWAPMLLAHWLYGRGVVRAWAKAGRGRIIAHWRVASFVGGEAALFAALVSPVDPLGETLLSAHMLQHILLTAVAPPLLVLGKPVRAWTWALPQGWRGLAATPAVKVLIGLSNRLTLPLIAMLVHGLTVWLWHAPGLFEAALEDEGVHELEHAAFLITALMFWAAVCRRETHPLIGAGMLLVTFMHGGMLGGVLTLSPAPLYDWYGNSPLLWGLSPLNDQQIAGLLMWVAAGAIYLSAFAWFVVRGIDSSRSRPRTGIIRASTSSQSMK